MGFQDWLKNLGKEGQKRAEEKAKKRAADPRKTGGPLGEYVDGHPVLTCPTETSPGSPIVNGLLKPLGLVDCKKPGAEKAKKEPPKNLAPLEIREMTPEQRKAEAARWEAEREAVLVIQRAKELSKADTPPPAAEAPAAPALVAPESSPAIPLPVKPPQPDDTRSLEDTKTSAYTSIRGRFSSDTYKGVTEKVGPAQAMPALQEIFASAVRNEDYDSSPRVARAAPVAPAATTPVQQIAAVTP